MFILYEAIYYTRYYEAIQSFYIRIGLLICIYIKLLSYTSFNHFVYISLPVYQFLNFSPVSVTVGRANVNDANQICHTLAQVQQTVRALHV